MARNPILMSVRPNYKPYWTMLLSFVLIVVGAAGLLLIQEPLRQSQDIRQQASVENGAAILTQSPVSGSIIPAHKNLLVTISFNTAGIDVTHLKLVFNLVTETLDEPPILAVVDSERFELGETEIEEVADGYLVSVAAGARTGPSFTNEEAEAMFLFSLTPVREGPIEFSYDPELSESIVANYDLAIDVLRHVPSAVYQVEIVEDEVPGDDDPADDEPEDDEPADDEPADDEPADDEPEDEKPADEEPDDKKDDTKEEKVGGLTYATCNESCNSNHDCAANLRCYHKQCRLAINVTSQTCTPRDKSTLASCNQSCSTNRDCGEGLACHYNRCRNPLNLESAACQAPTPQVAAAMTASCDQACVSHRDCPPNYLCYSGSRTCRLAINPQSSSCRPASAATVSDQYRNKGDDDGTATDSAQATVSARPTTPPPATTSPDPQAPISQTPSDMDDDSGFVGWLKSKSSPWVISLSRALGLAPNQLGLVLIGLGSLFWLMVAIGLLIGTLQSRRVGARVRAKAPTPTPPASPTPPLASTPGVGRPPVTPPVNLNQPPLPARPMTTAPTTAPEPIKPAPQPTPPVAPPATPTPPPTEPEPRGGTIFESKPNDKPAASNSEPATDPASKPTTSRSSMLERIKNKGVEVPKSKS